MTTSGGVPITILAGFLGAGKTTLLNHLLLNQKGFKIAVLVNDLASVNIDAKLVQAQGISKTKQNEKLVEFSNGCACCSLKDEVLLEIKKLAVSGKYNYIVLEGSGVMEPMPVAEGIENFDIGKGKVLSQVAPLDTIATVVDAKNFLTNFKSTDLVKDRKDLMSEVPETESKGEELEVNGHVSTAEHFVVELLLEQIEYANVIIINKTDLVTSSELEEINVIIRGLNPDAKIIHSQFGKIAIESILNTKLFDAQKASEMPGWKKYTLGDFQAKAKKMGVSSFVYKARVPFHPNRFAKLMENESLFENVVRSKGFFWLATRNDLMGIWSHAGELRIFECGGFWFDKRPKDEWPEDPIAQKTIKEDFDSNPEIADRRQELIFIGTSKMKVDEITKSLDSCLLTKEELTLGSKGWSAMEDPLEPWDDEQ